MFDHLPGALVHQARNRPHKIAVVAERHGQVVSITWQQLGNTVAIASDRVRRRLDPPGENIRHLAYRSHNGLADIVLALTCPLAGIIEIPIDHRLGDKTIGEMRKRSEGTWLDIDGQDEVVWSSYEEACRQHEGHSLMPALAATADQINSHAPALVLWTSGTTGRPKGVVLSHANLVGNAAAKLAAVPQSCDDVRLTTLPMCHAYARTCDFGTWLLSGCTLAIASGFPGWQSLGPLVNPTLANTVPSLAERLWAAPPTSVGTESLRLLGCGGAPLRPENFTDWGRRGVTVIQGYGLTEAGPVVCSSTPANAAPGLVGDLVEGWESDVRDGRLYVRGPHTMLGYLDDPAATSLRIDDDGWLDTGDVVEFDTAAGQFRILGRADETIVLDNGYKIHPREIESRVEGIGGVRHAMLVGDGRETTLWLETVDRQQRDSVGEQAKMLFAGDPAWQQPREIKFFEPPLSVPRGELTHKGAIRRDVVRRRL